MGLMMNSLSALEGSNTMRNIKTNRPKKAKKQNNNNNNNKQVAVRVKPRGGGNTRKLDDSMTFRQALIGGGNMLGNFLTGGLAPKIFGSGAYHIKENTAYDVRNQCPIMHSSNEKVTFRHREYITDVLSTGNFKVLSLPINPGLATTFPYLSSVASNFQEYHFTGLVFEYKSTSAVAMSSGTNVGLGSVSMVSSYRTDAPTFTSKMQLLNEMWSVDGRPSDNIVLPVECSPNENPFKVQYVRTQNVPAGSDVKTYDLANLTLATSGMPVDGNVVGELWASYEVELYKPIAGNINGLNLAGYQESRGGVSTSYLTILGTTSYGVPVNNGGFFVGADGIHLIFPKSPAYNGYYLIHLHYYGMTSAMGTLGFNNWGAGQVINQEGYGTAAGGSYSCVLLLNNKASTVTNPGDVTDPGVQVNCSPTSNGNVIITVTQLPNDGASGYSI